MRVSVLFLLLCFAGGVKAQEGNFFVTAGGTQYFGDIGDFGNGGNYQLSDVHWSTTRFNIGGGYQYFFNRFLGVKGVLQYGQISGNDHLSKEVGRSNRGVHFLTDIVQGSGLLTFKIPLGARAYLYAHSGITALYFDPKGMYNGRWYNLRSIGTEGQTLPNGTGAYSPVTAAIPYGGGFVVPIGRFGIGLDFTGYRAFSDYIDDVGGTWGNADLIAENSPTPEAAYALSTPENGRNSNGNQRGGANSKDYYYFLNLTFHINIFDDVNPYTRKNRKMYNSCPEF